MIALICLLAVLTQGNCLDQLPTRREIETSINRTIEEVERMVRDDPSLPRLTRNEIVDILFNITSMDMNGYADNMERTRENYQRALMVVLPQSSNESRHASLKDLWTNAPLMKTVQVTTRRPDTIKTSANLINTGIRKNEELSNESNHYENHRGTFAEVSPQSPTRETLQLLLDSKKYEETSPEKFSFNLANFGATRDKESPFGRPFLKNVSNKQGSTASKSNLEIVYSTSVTQRPTTKFVKTTSVVDKGFRPTMPSVRSTQNILTSDQWRYNAPPSSDTRVSERSTAVPFLPTMMTENVIRDTESSPTLNAEASTSARVTLRHEDGGSPWDMANLRIVNEKEKPAPFYVTPMSSTSTAERVTSLTIANYTEATKAPMPMREEVQDLLASIGLHPDNDQTNSSASIKLSNDHEKIFGTNFQIPDTSNVINGQPSGLTAVGIESASISGQNTFETTPQDVKKGVDNLSPDVQLMFQRFGLQSSAKDRENLAKRVTTAKPRVYTTKTSFWNNFKPLPASQVKDAGMRDFLAKFGLGIDDSRNEKSMKTRKHEKNEKPSLIEAVPGNMKRILENIGLITSSQRRPVDIERIASTEVSPHLHVFKPHETLIDNEMQRAKINELLDTVKMVQEGKADVLAVQKAAKELLETTKTLKNGPDPLSLEEILKIYNDDVKNEIKRQQDPRDLEDMAISENSDTASTTSSSSEVEIAEIDSLANISNSSGDILDPVANTMDTSNDSKNSGSLVDAATTENSNLEALADSFGGSTVAPDPVLPTPRKTGLYFLVDWNTFLEVGEEGADKVNLRFQPKAGDRTRFISVTVP